MCKAVSTPVAAICGVTSVRLPVGEYPTFLSVLAISAAYFYLACQSNFHLSKGQAE
jgi:hypothetical protein